MKTATIVLALAMTSFLVTAVGTTDRHSSPQARAGAATPEGITNSIGMRLAFIRAGKFTMGSPTSEREREPEELRHEVAITRPFYMGIHEVTQQQFEKLMGANPAFFKTANGGGPEHPVENVLWREAVVFCKKLSELPAEQAAGRAYRLPTEAEWEYACRAETKTAFHSGNALSSAQANFNGNFPYGKAEKGPYLAKPTKVGAYAPNAWGLHDLHGNVGEWCSDWYDVDYYATSPQQDPTGPAGGVMRTGFKAEGTEPGDTGFYLVARGGCWLDEARGCRSAYRFRFMPNDRYRLVGFRVVCTVLAK